MQIITGSLSAAGVSSAIYIEAGETLTAELLVAPAEGFDGIISVERSRDGINYAPAKDRNGVDVRFDGTSVALEGSVFSDTLTNDDSKRNLYRVRAHSVDGASDAIAYTLTEVVGDRVQVLFSDKAGRPIAWIRDDGSVEFAAVHAADFQGGAGVGLAIVNGLSREDVTTNGSDPTVLSAGVYESRILTSGSAGPEEATLGTDAYYIGQRKLITVSGLGDPGDSVVLDHESFLDKDGSELSALTIDAALNGFILAEFTGVEGALGARWQIIRAGENVTITPVP